MADQGMLNINPWIGNTILHQGREEGGRSITTEPLNMIFTTRYYYSLLLIVTHMVSWFLSMVVVLFWSIHKE